MRSKKSFHFVHIIGTKFSVRAISITMHLMFRLKVSIKVKIHIINTSNFKLYIKFFTGFDTLFLAEFCRFLERGCLFML